MTLSLTPYLQFRGEARAALAFYSAALGGEPEIATFAGFGMDVPAAEADWVMHGFLRTTAGLELMASDLPSVMPAPEPGSSVTLALWGYASDAATLRGWFAALAEGGTVTAPLNDAPWGAAYGALVDRFGTAWMVNIDPADAPA